MHDQTNVTLAVAAPNDTMIGTRRAIEVCVVCGHERVHGHRRQVSCPECASGVWYSSLLVHGLTEADR